MVPCENIILASAPSWLVEDFALIRKVLTDQKSTNPEIVMQALKALIKLFNYDFPGQVQC
jgi:hypothetical protein